MRPIAFEKADGARVTPTRSEPRKPSASPMLEAEHPGSAARRLCITEDFHGRPWDKHLAIMSWYWDVVRQCWTLLPPLAWSHPYALPLWTTEPCISGGPRGASSTSIDLDATSRKSSAPSGGDVTRAVFFDGRSLAATFANYRHEAYLGPDIFRWQLWGPLTRSFLEVWQLGLVGMA
ncbi:hypothetical protein HPB51_014383 [Rhipicephalus microplus]|uniref:Uncharacterized protein n=1 Tax=Rhipicephalus microplus TaxID=6941 RepID=A0A9J6F3I2_RHIMP|nr:hypothetical protein HPB51_014383 [Rhipicephalus microplus]